MWAGLLLLVAGCCLFNSYDEATHRTEFEKSQGHRVSDGDWQQWVKALRVLCDASDESFELTVEVARIDGADQLNRLRSGVRHLCPERMEQLDRVIREGYKDPCVTPAPTHDGRRATPDFCSAPDIDPSSSTNPTSAADSAEDPRVASGKAPEPEP